MQPRRSAPIGVAAVLLATLVAGRARALEADVDADTAMQAYSVRSPFGDPVLMRRRVTQTIGLGVYDVLADEKPGRAQVFVKLRMRLDIDAGIEGPEQGIGSDRRASRYVPGLREAPLDLMYGYVEGRHLAGGWLGLRVGRQYVTDSLGWWSFDGGLAQLSVPYARAEVYGGWEQRGGLPLSTARFEQGGVLRGNRSPVLDGSPDLFVPYLPASMAPAFGTSVETSGLAFLHARLDYRRVLNTGSAVAGAFPVYSGPGAGTFTTVSGTRTSSERLGTSIQGSIGDGVSGQGGLVYDFYNTVLSQYYVAADAFPSKRVTVSAEYDHYKPTFDGDSIFNWFTHSAIDTATLRGAVVATSRVDVAASAGVRRWGTDDDPGRGPRLTDPMTGRPLTDPEASSSSGLFDVLGSASARYRRERTRAAVRGVLETGERGSRKGLDLSGEQGFLSGRYRAEGRLSLFDWRDELRPDRSATSFGYVVGGGFRPGAFADVLVEWEHNLNRLVGQRYRVLALFQVRTTK